ncbi:MAG TPA: NAD(P)/FAD-dependent oxidoreductase [Gemmatimonadales bacterium]|nr:NAD(P)/FAD-dependent oxidoreductase [Gemmatimonadales bacterium]
MTDVRWDCVIAGGGPAGLSAALILGRARRRTLLCDTGEPRNRWSRAMHGYLTRDGVAPDTFLAIARAELARYPTIEHRRARLEDASRQGDGFELLVEGGERLRSRTVLVATGLVDELPSIDGLDALYGRSVHLCPYCDGWEHRDAAIAAFGRGEAGARLAIKLRQWSADVVWFADGDPGIDGELRAQLDAAAVTIRPERVRRLEGRDGRLERIMLDSVPPVERSALFLATRQRQASRLAERLGCRVNHRGTVDTGSAERTEIPGVFVAGDASKDAQLVIVAAAEGAEAGVAIDTLLIRLDHESRRSGEALRP